MNPIRKLDPVVRMKDIAEEAGVSRSLVSAVLTGSGKGKIRISSATAERVRAIAQKYHFRPNLVARTLSGKQSMKIGVLIDSQAPSCFFKILLSIENAAIKQGYSLMIGQAHDAPESLFSCYENFMQHGIDGVICLAHEYPQQAELVQKFFAPRHNICFFNPPAWEAPCVGLNYESGIREALVYLQNSGCRRIAYYMSHQENYYSLKQRIGAYRKYNCGDELLIRETNLALLPEIIRQQKIDAIIACNDVCAAKLAQVALQAKLQIPRDFALIGQDNDDYGRWYFPALSTIDPNADLVGQKCFEQLMKLLNGESNIAPCFIDTKLIIRQSSIRKGVSK